MDTVRSRNYETRVINLNERKPSWLKVRAPGGTNYTRIKSALRRLELHTVCQEAHCPNVGECWREGTATILLLGDVCTRGCRFCAVQAGNPRGVVDPDEPEHVARAVGDIGLRYAVLTMVNRDDLRDGGAAHVRTTIERIRELNPQVCIEALVGDFQGQERDIDAVLDARPDVFGHNVEVVRRITRIVRDTRCSYDRSLHVLEYAKTRAPDRLVKSGVMVGAGETDEELFACLTDLRANGVDIVTIGQYLRPSPRHHPVERYVEPDMFEEYRHRALALGFHFVAAGPMVRSSYQAAEGFARARIS